MRHLILILTLVILTGCMNGNKNPLGPSLVAPGQLTSSPTPVPQVPAFYVNPMETAQDLSDYVLASTPSGAMFPSLISGGHTGTYGHYPPNGSGIPKSFLHDLPAVSGTKITATYWVYGISVNSGVGIVYSGQQAGFRMAYDGVTNTRTISYYDDGASGLVVALSIPNIPSYYDVWREFKYVLDQNTGDVDYYLDGLLVGANKRSSGGGFNAYVGRNFVSILEYTSASSEALNVDDISMVAQ